MIETTRQPDPDAWLDDVRRWYFGGTPPLSYADSELPMPPAPLSSCSPAASDNSVKKAAKGL